MQVSYPGFLAALEADQQSFDAGGQPPKDQQAVHDFMGQVTEWMDEDPDIE